MENHSTAELSRFLQNEADTLQQMQMQISNELHRLQVEEEVFVRTIDRLNENSKNTSNTEGRNATAEEAGLELLEALQLELSVVPSGQIFGPISVQANPVAIRNPKAEDKIKEQPQAEDMPTSFNEDEDDEYELLLNRLESGDVKLLTQD